MSGLLFALLATLVAGFAARDQVLVAQFSARFGARPGLLLVALACAAATMATAAAAALWLAPRLTGNARVVFAALALGLAGIEMLFARRRPPPAEPTQSLGAFAIVLFAQQLTDAARFVVFAIAVATRAPLAVGIGGALGAMAMITFGWSAGAAFRTELLAPWRRALGTMVLILALIIGAVGSGRI